MRIEDHQVRLSSTHSYVEKTSETESLRVWGAATLAIARPLAADTVQLSRTAPAGAPAPEPDSGEEGLEGTDGSKLMLWKLLIERITGRKIRVLDAEDLEAPEPQETPTAAGGAAPAEPAFGLEYTRSELHAESESTRFSAQGSVRTEDGREIDFAVESSLAREYVEARTLTVRIGQPPKDPLVLNLDGNAAQLTGGRFAFDIDADGNTDAVPLLSGGSAFLTLDRNGDGIVNDGSELFGPSTGDGFAELASHDSNKNRWIDENDADFGRLGLWSPASSGGIVSLAERGVGAIYLDRATTAFALRTAANEALGQLRSTGVYLNENGAAGTVQQLDLSV